MMGNEYAVGDLVEAVKGETVLRGRLWSDPFTGELAIPGINDPGYVKELTGRLGFTLTVIEKAAPMLPTGTFTTIRATYLPAGNLNTKTTHLTLLPFSGGSGKAGWSYSNGIRVREEDIPRIQSFEVVAEPVPATAKKVIDAVGEYLDGQLVGRTKDDIIAALAEEFGVTGDPR